MAHIIGKRIYYRIDTGEILHETEDRVQLARDTTVEEDLRSVKRLSELKSEEIGHKQFSYKELEELLLANNANAYSIDPNTGELIYAYRDEDGNLTEPPTNTGKILKKIKKAKEEVEERIDEESFKNSLALAEIMDFILEQGSEEILEEIDDIEEELSPEDMAIISPEISLPDVIKLEDGIEDEVENEMEVE